jgi:hypothetical protein
LKGADRHVKAVSLHCPVWRTLGMVSAWTLQLEPDAGERQCRRGGAVRCAVGDSVTRAGPESDASALSTVRFQDGRRGRWR